MTTVTETEAMEIGTSVIEAWNAHDINRVVSHYAPDYLGTDVGQARPSVGIDGIRLKVALFLRAFPDATFETVSMTAQGDQLALRWLARGAHRGKIINIPPTGQSVTINGALFLTIRQGKIVSAFYLWDVAGLLRAIGLLPELPDE